MKRSKVTPETALALGKLVLRFGEVNRATFHEDGTTPETDTTHTVMLALIAVAMCPGHLDSGMVAQYALVHDLVESYAGDTNTAFITEAGLRKKEKREKVAMNRIRLEFGDTVPILVEMIEQYERQVMPEARFVRFLDKAMPKITHVLNGCATVGRGRTKKELRAAHSVQLTELLEQYPELIGTEASRLMAGLMSRAEDELKPGTTTAAS